MTGYQQGIIDMARNCISAIDLMEKGGWDTRMTRRWLQAVIDNDLKFLAQTKEQLIKQLNEF